MFFLSSKSSPSEPEEMVWISSLSTAVAEVWPAVGFRLVPLSPSLSVLLDSVKTSWGGRRVKGKRVNGESPFTSRLLPKVRQRGAEIMVRGRLHVGWRKIRQEVKAKEARKDLTVMMVKDLVRWEGCSFTQTEWNRAGVRYNLRKVTYIRVGLSWGQEAPALMHTSLTRWAAKTLSLHGRRIVTIISSALSNSDGRGRDGRSQVNGCFFWRLERRQTWKQV